MAAKSCPSICKAMVMTEFFGIPVAFAPFFSVAGCCFDFRIIKNGEVEIYRFFCLLVEP